MLAESLALYFIMGSSDCSSDPTDVLRQAVQGGVTMFQYREKGTGRKRGKEVFLLGQQLKQICGEYDVPFIVNDDLDLAVALDADGLHVGQEDLEPNQARKSIGPQKILGVSVQTIEEADKAVQAGADYLGVGPMYPTLTKKDARTVIGPAAIQRIKSCLSVPVVGIGGIREGNAGAVLEAGAEGIAVVSVIAQSDNPYETAHRLSRIVKG